MKAKPQIPLTIAYSVLALAFCTGGLAQSKPAATPSQPPTSGQASPSPASPSPVPNGPTPTTALSTSTTATSTPPAGAHTGPPKGTATVEFHNGLLHIIATDADLNSVLQQVSRATGMRLQGGTHGDRLYGDYGPAIPADVLGHMLGGLPYNFIMTQAPRTTAPQQLVISSRHGGATTTATGPANGSQTAQPSTEEPQPYQPDAEEQAAPPEPPPTVDVIFAPTNSATDSKPDNTSSPPDSKTPEQFLDELKQSHDGGKPQ